MNNKRLVNHFAASVLCMTMFPIMALADEPVVCDLYSIKATAQAKTQQQYSCGLAGNRYSTDYQLHYKWCLKVSGGLPAKENRARVVELANCPQTHWDRDADTFCTEYSNIAVQQNALAQKNKCGFTKPRWDAEFGSHYRWCMGVPGILSESETNERRLALQSCSGQIYPAVAPAFSGDLKLVDWCLERATGVDNWLLDVVFENTGSSIWSSKKDGLLIVGLYSSGTLKEPRRTIPFAELYGMLPLDKRIISGVNIYSIMNSYYPTAEVVFAHDEDINTPDRSLKVVFGTKNFSEFLSKDLSINSQI